MEANKTPKFRFSAAYGGGKIRLRLGDQCRLWGRRKSPQHDLAGLFRPRWFILGMLGGCIAYLFWKAQMKPNNRSVGVAIVNFVWWLVSDTPARHQRCYSLRQKRRTAICRFSEAMTVLRSFVH